MMNKLIYALISILFAMQINAENDFVFCFESPEALMEEMFYVIESLPEEQRIEAFSAIASILAYYMRLSGIESDSTIVTKEAFAAINRKTVKQIVELADALTKEENQRLFNEGTKSDR